MSLNSSSKLNLKPPNAKSGHPGFKATNQDFKNSNLGKSQSGFIKSILEGQPPIEMKMEDASLTLNNSQK